MQNYQELERIKAIILKNETHRLGDYIREVNVRNRDLKVTRLLGLSIEKRFIPSIANTIGTDMAGYKVVREGQFAYVPVTSRNGEKITVALLEDCDEAIISQAYTVFEVVDCDKLLPQYLMMWFRRPEFDRYARFHSHGSAREVFDWDELCDVLLPVPDIERQREIVAEYKTLTKRIRLNEQMIAHLEATAQALYRHTFIDNIDKQNLPPGWHLATLGEVCTINPKLALKTGNLAQYFDMDSLPIQGFFMDKVCIKEFNGGMKFQNGDVLFARITPCLENGKAAIVADLNEDEIAFGSTEYIVLRGKLQKLTSILATLTRNEEFRAYAKSQMKGTDGRQRVDANALLGYEIAIPDINTLREIEDDLSKLFHQMHILTNENREITELQSLLLAKMGQ